MSDFTVKRGSLQPAVEAVLKRGGNAIDLTGCTVTFVYRNNDTGTRRESAAFIFNQSTDRGKVKYTPSAGDRDEAGHWVGEWLIASETEPAQMVPDTLDNPFIYFDVLESLAAVADGTPISIFYAPLRHLLADNEPQAPRRYEDAALLDAVRTMLFMGKLSGYTLTPDRQAITPAIDNPNILALLLYETVLSFYRPLPTRQSARTRAFSSSVGSFARYVTALEEHVHDLRNGTMFSGWQSLHAWCIGTTGLDLREVCRRLKAEG
jgi:hypothetical protein